MRDTDRWSDPSTPTPASGEAFSPGVATQVLPAARPTPEPPSVPTERHAAPPAEEAPLAPHPVVLVDPGPASLVTVWSLRRRSIPLHALGSRWMEPVLWARGVRRHHLPHIDMQPLAWSARLLELVAFLEPRPVIIPCSRRARDLLRDSQAMLQPHYDLAHLEPLALRSFEAEDFRTEQALRRTVLRGEPAFEVQVTLDRQSACTGACVLTWMAGVPPTVLVSSVEGDDVLERSLQWLRSRNLRGYARMIWAPDRFGRIELQAAGTLPGSGLLLAVEDGVDLPLLWFCALVGIDRPPQWARKTLSRQFGVGKAGDHGDNAPLLAPPIPWSRTDPLPFLVRWLAGFGRP